MKKIKISFAKRATVCFFLIICLFFCTVLRVGDIALSSEYLTIQSNQSSYRISISRLRGTIYDCNLLPITNNRSDVYIAASSAPNTIIALSESLKKEEYKEITEKFKENNFAVLKVGERVNCENVANTQVVSTDNDSALAKHIVGYTDDSGHGVCGIQKAYDNILYSKKTVDAVFSVNGKGETLYGIEPDFENDFSVTNSGVVTTLDLTIQKAVEEAGNNLNKGCIIICDANEGKIKAMVSRPDFDLNNLAKDINNPNYPFLNRALSACPVGSVFKPCVAAAALENGNKYFCYDCKGKCKIIDRYFSCHEKSGHGVVGLKDALSFSCNTYFYNLGINLGGEKIYNTAKKLGFGNSLKIGNNIKTDKGNLTSIENLKNDALLANFSIGQGDITVSPTSMLTLYLAIVGEGKYSLPHIIEGTVSENNFVPYDYGNKTTVMEKETANYIKTALRDVVLKGTGKTANSENVEISGKTATAQTGKYYKNGAEITNSWFCGFFPYDKPEYVGIVMSQGESKTSTAEIFKEIAEKIYNK